jgi:hypothetical protein
MLWQRIFEANRLNNFAYLYHPGWLVMLLGELALGVLLMIPNWRAALFYVTALVSLGMGGLEDVLYYWFDHRAIPNDLPWLDPNPWIFFKPVTSTGLLLSVAIWLAIVIVFFIYWERREALSASNRLSPVEPSPKAPLESQVPPVRALAPGKWVLRAEAELLHLEKELQLGSESAGKSAVQVHIE